MTEPTAFFRHLIATVTCWASPELFIASERDALERATTERRRRAGRQTIRRFHLGTPGWLADAGIAYEVRTTGEDIVIHSSASDAVAQCRRLVGLFRSHELGP